MLNLVWVAFILIGFMAAFLQWLQGDMGVFARVLTGLFDSARTGFDVSIGLVGIMKVGERAGLIEGFARA